MKKLAVLSSSAVMVLLGILLWLTPEYPHEKDAFLGQCDGYGLYLYGNIDEAICPSPIRPLPDLTHEYQSIAGTVAFHPVSRATLILQLQTAVDTAEALKEMRSRLEELLEHATPSEKGNLLFPYLFDWPYDFEKAPWYSSMAQGLAGAAFMAGWRVFEDERYLEAAIQSIEAIRVEGARYKFYRLTEKGVWFKEYLHNPYSVLDGSLIAISAIHDVYQCLPEKHALKPVYREMYLAGLAGFKDEWRRFDAPYGLYFEDSKRRVTPDYYGINMAVLKHLGKIDPEIEAIRQKYILQDGFFPRFFTTVSGAFFKITRRWWPHTPIGIPAEGGPLPAFVR